MEEVTAVKVLVMDDEEDIRDLLIEALTRYGYEVETARDGAQAVDMYNNAREQGQPYNVVLMDLIVLDGMGGHEALQKLKEIDPGVKAIASSGRPAKEIDEEVKEKGFSAAIAKPYNINELKELLRKVITGAKQ